MPFEDRPPSAQWAPASNPRSPGLWLWAWFKPPALPHAVVVRVPPEVFADPRLAAVVTVRNIVQVLDLEPGSLAGWSLGGAMFDSAGGMNPAFDAVIPPAAVAAIPDITLFFESMTVASATGAIPSAVQPAFASPAAGAMPIALTGSATPHQLAALERMASDWNAVQQIEVQLASAAQQLNGSLSRVNSLNRDLSPEESRFGDNLDKKEWADARRWLRDAAAKLSRFIKDYQIGMTSAAGRRNLFADVVEQFIQHRVPFEGMEQMEREFEQYRKSMQTLLVNMNSAHGSAVQDAERRAQAVLSRISAKARTKSRKTT